MTCRILALVLVVLLFGCSGKGKSPTGPSGPGSARLVSTPGSATAATIINGTTVTKYTPATFDNLASGPFAATLTMAGYADTTVLLSVPAGGTIEATILLRPLAGSPTSITEIWSGLFTYVGPMAVGSTGNFYATAHSGLVNVLAVIAPSGAILHQELIPDPDADPAADIALDSNDNAFVLPKTWGNTIMVFNAAGSFVRTIARRDPSGSGGITGIAVGPGDTVHVSARYGGTPVIEKYSSAGTFAYAFPTGASGPGRVEVLSDGSIFVGAGASASTPEIRRFSRTGALIQAWAVSELPQAITRGPGGALFVSSYWGEGVPANTAQAPSRMEKFAADGVRQALWGIENGSTPYLDRHAVRADGTLYVPRRNDERVLEYAGFR